MATFAQLTQEQQGAVEKARNRVIEAIGQNMDLYGMTQSTGHCTVCYFSAIIR